MDLEGKKIYTVSELNREIRAVLEDTYPLIWVEGELANVKTYPSGHTYCSLKDEDGQISAVLFQGYGKFIRFALENGLKVIARGKVSAYPKRGEYQFIITSVEPAGTGALHAAFEQLKKRLEAEGLFDPARKKTIPSLPGRIGIVTSIAGAALQDILSVIERRYAGVGILIHPVRVQGDEAGHDIAAAITYLNRHHADLDVLLVGRGGGSYEDLWAFNEEIVARAIAASRIPVISCVGHETDFTIADMVADMRAPTPSAAAELVVSSKTELMNRLRRLRSGLASTMRARLNTAQARLSSAQRSRALTRPQEILQERMQDLDRVSTQLAVSLRRIAERKQAAWQMAAQRLELLSPLAVLGRGYAICSDTAGTVIKDSGQLRADDQIRVRLGTGRLSARVTATEGA